MEYKGFIPTVGLEVHVELKTDEKLFCSCSAVYGGEPDSKTCPVCLGASGAVPVLNFEAVRLGVAAGLVLGCRINKESLFDRKHYTYPDLPKGYQLTQYYSPLCEDGEVRFFVDGVEKTVGIERIHLEEDAGKLSYRDGEVTVDHNRCGVPLIEIVTRPDIHSAEEAVAFVTELRRLLLFAGVSDCKMNEGSLRCDVNISVSPAESEKLGDRCEIKNINSVYFIGKAIEHELRRQTELVLSGERVECETRRFSESGGVTERMRPKETAEDYGYTRDYGIPPVVTDSRYIGLVRESLPASASEYMSRFEALGVKKQDTELICTEPEYARYFERCAENGTLCAAVTSLFISEVLPMLRSGEATLPPETLRDIAALYTEGEVNIVSARRLVSVCTDTGEACKDAAERLGLYVLRDTAELKRLIASAIEALPKAVEDIRKGKESAKKVLVGRVMKESGGRADPTAVKRELDRFLAEKPEL